jgi:AraC-like DNA-binding protein
MSATDACFRSGWRSYSSFTRAYGKRFGSTPTGRRDTAVLAEETYE